MVSDVSSGYPWCPEFFLCAVHGRCPVGESPLWGFVVANNQLNARMSVAEWNLKEAGGKFPPRFVPSGR